MSKRVSNKKGRQKLWARSYAKTTKYTDENFLRDRRLKRRVGAGSARNGVWG